MKQIERLRAVADDMMGNYDGEHDDWAVLLRGTADYIDALEARVDSLMTSVIATGDEKDAALKRAEAAERALAEAVEVLTTLESVADQFTTDLSAAHAEICNLQGIDPSKHTWPDWSAPANTLRWWAKEKPRARAFLTKRGEK